MTRSSIRHAIFEQAPAERGTLIETVAEEINTDTAVIDDTLDHLERRGEVYLADGEVRETGGGA